MSRATRMAGARRGLTYAAALVLVGLLVAMFATQASSQTAMKPAQVSNNKGFIGVRLQRSSPADVSKTTRREKLKITAVAERPRVIVVSPTTTDRTPNPG